jgi:acetyl-CoA carboxylase biotin carboxylase subunit
VFGKVLVANRGEIALRVMRTCRELGIATVAIFSEADKDALHVQYADEAYNVGPAPASKSYLHIPHIIEIANKAGVEAIHPGYGFLAENPHFASVCQAWGIEFIGPSSEAIEEMGFKEVARKKMIEAGVPVIPGTDHVISDPDQAALHADEVGYPVLIKAAAGGGGRGIRIAHNEKELLQAVETAQREARSAFNNDSVYLEKYLERPRHVEFQILSDKHGNMIHLGERESSLQRRLQKVVEEAPCTAVTPELREEMSAAALRAARAANYTGAGTVEFLLDEQQRFYFIEMNARIQVEHPVTELVTGVDIVKEQLLAAYGEPLSVDQSDVELSGAAIECRISAEDPENDFLPSPGKITDYQVPGGFGVRVDSALYTGYTVQPYYDSLVAKIIVWGSNRSEAIARMQRALQEFKLKGIKTTIPLHQQLMEHPDFRDGRVHTRFLEDVILRT